MNKTVITVRLDANKRDIVKAKCDNSRISMNQLFERLCDLIINDSINVTEKGISLVGTETDNNDDEDKHSLSMQIAVINERLSKVEQLFNADNIYVHNLHNTFDTDSSVIASDSLSSLIQSDIKTDIETDTDKEDITENITLLECDILPLNEDLGNKVSDDDNKVTEDDKPQIGTLKEALDNVILPELAKGTKTSDIAKLLKGKYLASVSGTSVNWQTSVVDRAIDSRNKGKT